MSTTRPRSAEQNYRGQLPGTLRFLTSEERDAETGLDYFGARYCANAKGRFTSADPVTLTRERLVEPQRLSLYCYVSNNPLRYTDPNGRDLKPIAGQSPTDVNRIVANLAAIYQKSSGRAGLQQMEHSAISYPIGVGSLPTSPISPTAIEETFGQNLVAPNGTVDPKNPKITLTINRTGTTDTIVIEFAKRDKYEAAGTPHIPSEVELVAHEVGHGIAVDTDPVKAYNDGGTPAAEVPANSFVNTIRSKADTVSFSEALIEVERMLDLLPKAPAEP